MAWTDQMVEDLKRMWKEGLTTGEIGKRLGVSKNSIVGKVHRLGLSGRPSPIKKKTETASSAHSSAQETSRPTSVQPKSFIAEKKPLHAEPVKPAAVKKEPFKEAVREETPISAPIETRQETGKGGKVLLTNLDNHTCRWPVGDPKDENFHFCGKKVRLGQTYCEEHAALAYVKPNNKR